MKIINKLFLLVTLGFLTFGCSTEKEGFTITGTVVNIEDIDTVILYGNKNDTLAIAPIIDNAFKLEGIVTQPTESYIIAADRKISIPIILENDDYQATCNGKISYATGGNLNTVVNKFSATKAYTDAVKDLIVTSEVVFKDFETFNKEQVENARTKYRAKEKVVKDIIKLHQESVLNGDYPTLAKLFTLKSYQDSKSIPFEERLTMLDDYEKELGTNKIIETLRNNYKKSIERQKMLASVAVGKSYKDVIGISINSEELKLSDVIKNNKYTLLDFWASWCGPCRGEFPHLKKAYNKYNVDGFEIFALSIDEKREAWIKASETEQLPWLNIIDLDGFKAKGIQEYGVRGIPANFLIDTNGIIVATNLRGFGLDEALKELFKK